MLTVKAGECWTIKQVNVMWKQSKTLDGFVLVGHTGLPINHLMVQIMKSCFVATLLAVVAH